MPQSLLCPVEIEELSKMAAASVWHMACLLHRDSFQNVVELLDDLFRRAAEAEEPEEDNFVRKHSKAMQGNDVDVPTARLFSNPAGDYGSMVNERVGASNWSDSQVRPLSI
jgi:cobalamin biosynthesis Mg chelatase CobN